jgi:hypothetical protein
MRALKLQKKRGIANAARQSKTQRKEWNKAASTSKKSFHLP